MFECERSMISASASGQHLMGTKPSHSGHLPINGLNLYHEVFGDLGKSTVSPLLLIPGAFMATDSMKSWASAFAAERTVIVFDQQGHGRTPDTSRKMSYEQFADDAAALLRALEVERADAMGELEMMSQLPSASGRSMPSHMRRVEPLRPAWPSCRAMRAGVRPCTNSRPSFRTARPLATR